MEKKKVDGIRRNRVGTKIKTRSLTLHPDLIKELSIRTAKRADRNMSALVEEEITNILNIKRTKLKLYRRRPWGTYPVKKTFTFSNKFWNKIIRYGNVSLFIETLLAKKYSLKIFD